MYSCNFVFLYLCFSGLGKVRGVSEQFLILIDWPHRHQRQRAASRVNPAFIWSNFLAYQCYSSSDISVLDHFRPGVIVFQDIYLHLEKPQKLKPLTYIPNSIKNTVVVCLLPNIEWSIVQWKRTCCVSVYLNNYRISGRGVAISHRGIERISPHDSLLEYWSPILRGVFGVTNASASRISHSFYVHHLPGHLWIIWTDIDMGKFLFKVSILIAIPCPSPIETDWKKKFS